MPGNMRPPAWRESICWECEKEFELTPDNMVRDQPLCDACARPVRENPLGNLDFEEYIRLKNEMAKLGFTRIQDIPSSVLWRLKLINKISEETIEYVRQQTIDEPTPTIESSIPVIQPIEITEKKEIEHSSDCASFLGLTCDCVDEIDYT
jgi:hypothetical protein